MCVQTGKNEIQVLKTRLQRSAWNNALLIRSRESLDAFHSDAQAIEQKFQAGVRIDEPSELLLNARLFCEATSYRHESRGGHYREDFPDLDSTQPARATILCSDEERIKTESHLLDPDWDNQKSDLGQGRWG